MTDLNEAYENVSANVYPKVEPISYSSLPVYNPGFSSNKSNKVVSDHSNIEPNDNCNGCRKEKGMTSMIRTTSYECKKHWDEYLKNNKK
jgi:hypothetical protein